MEKKEFIYWAKIVCLFLYGMLTIVTCAGVWNYNPEGFVKLCAGLLLAANGVSIYCLAKKLKFPEKENIEISLKEKPAAPKKSQK